MEDFARAIEQRPKQGAGPEAVANYICRLLTSSDEKVAAAMWCKWVGWRYGKAREYLEHSIVEHSMTIEEGRALARKMLEIDELDNKMLTIDPTDNGTG